MISLSKKFDTENLKKILQLDLSKAKSYLYRTHNHNTNDLLPQIGQYSPKKTHTI